MDDYRIICQVNPYPHTIPQFYRRGFWFHEYDQLQQQNNGRFYLLSALNQTTRQADARCAFFIQADQAVSPLVAPFGSVEFVDTLPDSVLDTFVETLLLEVRRTGVGSLRLTHYPSCYDSNQTNRLTATLRTYGFDLIKSHPTYFLPITDNPFSYTLAPAEQRRLRKCQRAGFQVVHQSLPKIPEIVRFIQETRHQKGYPLTITPNKLANLLNRFPEQYPVFTVMDGTILTALTITVRVRHDILYTFLPASHLAYQSFSPMVLLTDGLYHYCQQHQIRLLDLGVSLDHHRQPKPSLMRFKRNLGAQESPKLVFQKLF